MTSVDQSNCWHKISNYQFAINSFCSFYNVINSIYFNNMLFFIYLIFPINYQIHPQITTSPVRPNLSLPLHPSLSTTRPVSLSTTRPIPCQSPGLFPVNHQTHLQSFKSANRLISYVLLVNTRPIFYQLPVSFPIDHLAHFQSTTKLIPPPIIRPISYQPKTHSL